MDHPQSLTLDYYSVYIHFCTDEGYHTVLSSLLPVAST